MDEVERRRNKGAGTEFHPSISSWVSGKEPTFQSGNTRDMGSFPGSRRCLWRRKWQPSPVFLPRESAWTEEPGRLQAMGSQRVRHNSATKPLPQSLGRGFPGGASDKEPTCQCRRHKRLVFDLWVEKIPWRRAWQPPSVFLPGESHGQRGLENYIVHRVTKSWT